MIKSLLFLALFLLASPLRGELLVELDGYLGKKELIAAHRLIEEEAFKGAKHAQIVLRVHSSSGELKEVLRLAQEIAELKRRFEVQITVYIQGKAVGPAAVFPFLADRLLITPLVAWGDITYRQEKEDDWEAVSKTLKQLSSASGVRGATISQLANAMVDARYQLSVEREGGEGQIASHRFDPLILNRKGIEALDLITPADVMTDEEFDATYLTASKQSLEPSSKDVTASSDALREQFKRHLSYAQSEKNLIGYLSIRGERPIDQTTYLYVKFALKEYKKRGVRCILLHLDTPGGEVLSSLKIVDLLQAIDINDQIPVIAFIDHWAVSAGAMLAYSCRFIGIVPNALMGAAEPILMGKQGEMQSAPEKVNSVLRTEFTNLANFYGRNPLIAKAMVDKDLILVIRNHEIIELKREEEIRIGGANQDKIITDKGKLLTLDAKQLIEFGVADFMVPLKPIAAVSEAEEEKGAWPAAKSLVFEQPYLASIPNAEIISYENWKLTFFSFLSHPAVAGILLLGLIIGFYIEINTPGFGVPGAIGISCLALILISSFASEAINWIEVIILAAGVTLLLLELFVIPGFGITGILGIILTVIGLFALMLPSLDQLSLFDPDAFELVGLSFFERLAWLCGALIAAVVVIVVLARLFSHHFFRFSKLILKGEQEKKEGYLSGIPRGEMPDIGELGETLTPLRPSGKVHIGDNLFDGITQGNYLEAYVAVEVMRIEGSKVVVRAVEDKGE